jgi:uncharacterized repeat protein (TIGR03809 family)
MTYRTDVAWGRDVVARWYGLAERRLAHLTELFETGRWRRYYSENVFLENIREAKAMLETWRDLTLGKVPLERPQAQVSSLQTGEGSGSGRILRDQVFSPPGEPLAAPQVPPISDISVALEADPVPLAQDPVAEDSCGTGEAGTVALEPAAAPLDLAAIEERYPLLRNSL